jgi:rfaE bifunctional protein kinase chain/domain
VTAPIVVVGDALLDVDVHGRSERLCPDAPVPVLDVVEERARPGGAGLAAVLLAAGGAPVTLVTALDADPDAARLRELLEPAVRVVAGPARGGTPVKCRWLAQDGPLLRTDRGCGTAAPGVGAAVADDLRAALAGAAAVLVSDYGRRVGADPAVRRALAAAAESGTPVVWDPHPRGTAPVPGVVATPNAAEAAAFAPGSPEPAAAAAHLRRRWAARAVVVTRGADGVVLDGPGACGGVAAEPVSGGDACGAGDAFAGALATALAGGAGVRDAAAAACRAAGEFVRCGGAAGLRRAGTRWSQREPAGQPAFA